MALIHTIPQTDATIPDPVRRSGNGTLPTEDWLRSFDGTTATAYKMFTPVAYAMQALILAALLDGHRLTTTGRYRSLAQQEALFFQRYSPGPFDPDVHRTSPSIQRRVYAGREWFLLKGMAMAATPGTSNHGWGIADDICEAPAYDGGQKISLRDPALEWLRDNAGRFGFALDTWEERWHWHWYRPGHVCELTQDTVDVLYAAGIAVPDLSTFGFTAPAPTPLEEDDMFTDDDRATLAEIRAQLAEFRAAAAASDAAEAQRDAVMSERFGRLAQKIDALIKVVVSKLDGALRKLDYMINRER